MLFLLKKLIFIFALILILLNISCICAEDNATDISNATQSVSSNIHTFNDLQQEISHADAKSRLYLEGTYKFEDASDAKLKSGVSINKDITIIGRNGCTIDGSGKARCLVIKEGCSVVLQNIKIKNGYTKTSGAGLKVAQNSKATIKNCQFTNNVADNCNGGAIEIKKSSSVKIYSTTFKNNKATRTSKLPWEKDKRGMGGAIKTDIGVDLKIYDSKFNSNSAYLSAILVLSQQGSSKKTSSIYAKNCVFTKNKSNHNGMIYSDEYGKATIMNCRFTKNNSPDGAGCIVLESSRYALVKKCVFYKNRGCNGAAINVKIYKSKDTSNVKIDGCKFIKNSVRMYGGAICSVGGKVTVKNSVFSSNTAGIFGGAIYARLGNLYVSSSKFGKNKAKYAGAVCMASKKGSLKHSSLTGNRAYYLYGAVYKVNHNKLSKCHIKSNKVLKYSKIYLYRSGKYIKVMVTNNTDGAVKKRVKLIFTGSKKVQTKWHKTSDKKYKKIRIPKSVKGKFKVTMKVSHARYFSKAIEINV